MVKTYSWEKIRDITFKYEMKRDSDGASPAEIYVTRHVNRSVKKGDKQKAINYLKKKGWLK